MVHVQTISIRLHVQSTSPPPPPQFSLLILSVLKMPHFHFLRLPYRQLLVCDDEQIGVGGLHFGAGAQFDALVGGLPGRSEQTQRAKHTWFQPAGKNTQSCNGAFDWTHRDKCATPDSRLNLHIVVALDLDVFQNAFYIAALCSFAVLLIK